MGMYVLGIWFGALVVCVGISLILANVLGFNFWIFTSMFPVWTGSALLVQSVVFAFHSH